MTGYLPSYVLLENTVNVLRSLVADSKGLVVAAHDPAAGLELLHNAPQQWRVIVGLDNEDSPEDISLKGVSNTEVFTMVQMPGGIPVATFAIGEAGATNAALFAIAMLALNDAETAAKLADFRQRQKAKVLAKTLDLP